MEIAAAAAAIIAAGIAMGGKYAFTNILLLFTLRRYRPPLKALPSRIDEDEEISRTSLIYKPGQKLERSSLDSHSCNNKYLPPSPRHFRSNDNLQDRMKAYRAKWDRQVLDEGVSTEQAFYREFADYVSSVWLHKDLARKYYEKALSCTQMEMDANSSTRSRNAGGLMAEYAEFQWKALGNDEEANRIFENAVRTYPEDVLLLGSYASFLWELSDTD